MEVKTRTLVVNEDDPFLKFLDYSQKKIDEDYQKNDLAIKYPLALRVPSKESKASMPDDPQFKLKVKNLVR